MMRWLMGIIIGLLLPVIAYSVEPLKGFISQHRMSVAETTSSEVDAENLSIYPPMDPDCAMDLAALKKGLKHSGNHDVESFLMPGSLTTPELFFSVSSPSDPHTYFYDFSCQLISVSRKENQQYPFRERKISYPEGEEISSTLHLSENQAISFAPNGKIIGQWQNGVFLKAVGNENYYP